MSRPLPPPPTDPGPAVGEFGGGPPPAGGPGGPTGLPAPPQPPSPGSMQDIADVVEINNRLKSLDERHPQITPDTDRVRTMLQIMQMNLLQGAPPTEVAAPPV